MSKGRYFGHVALALASTMVMAACSSDTPTSPATASQSLTEAARTIALSRQLLRTLLPFLDVRVSTRVLLLLAVEWILIHQQHRRWDPQLDIHQECDLDQEIAEVWDRAVYHEGVGRWHRPASRQLLWPNQGVGHGSDEQPTDHIYKNVQGSNAHVARVLMALPSRARTGRNVRKVSYLRSIRRRMPDSGNRRQRLDNRFPPSWSAWA